MKKSFLVIGLVFIIVGLIFLYLHLTLSKSSYIKGVIPIKAEGNYTISISYSSFVFEYKDNTSEPLQVIPVNSQIINTTYSNGIYYVFGKGFYNSQLLLKNNYTQGVLVGFVLINDSPIYVVYSLSLVFFIISLVAGIIIASLSFLFKGSDTEED
ncbi:hypothetical protein [Stygiolobus azoricus]|uniref:Uncharacterized protein n=1 Tax=Stygiolobus azoricus TaxID=41675 RepID=A0A650CN57_9CREN|nr:hypothetical protein [Stygiolobus azoricus]QGR19115.1 hypothetical protein D1868_03395 [Stygiolobus azoricus]